MQFKKLMLGIPVFLCAALLVTSSPISGHAAVKAGKQATAQQKGPTAKGKVLGMSNKAKTITIKDKKLGLVMIKFNDDTKGLEHAKKGEAAIVKYKVLGADKIATVIKPKLAKLPKGVTEIMPNDLAELIDSKADYMLIDSRPGKRYAAGHIATAISMPVDKLKKEGKTLLPQDNKDKLLIFYCGGPT
ncbi:MAG: rhodanese-like domain-containing protein [Desulfobulbaceae bacterium]|nr:rhodanese-like domain-containing protein [Desulfobulbaceae bacterium]